VIEDNYRQFVDVREAEDTGKDEPQPVARLRDLDVGGALGFTDILLLK
jgi:hypothetical protein